MITLVIQVTFSRDKNDMSDTLLKIRTGVLIVYAIGIIIGLAVVLDNINVNFSNGVFVYQFFVSFAILFVFYNFSRYLTKVGTIFIVCSFLQLFFVFSRYEIPWMP